MPDQAGAQLAQAQKALNALKQRLAKRLVPAMAIVI
jgi:hypothetical protein